MLMTMSKVQAENLISLGANRDDVPNRFLEELKRLLVLNATDADVEVSIKTKLYTVSVGEVEGGWGGGIITTHIQRHDSRQCSGAGTKTTFH